MGFYTYRPGTDGVRWHSPGPHESNRGGICPVIVSACVRVRVREGAYRGPTESERTASPQRVRPVADLKRANSPQDESAVADLRRKWSTIPKLQTISASRLEFGLGLSRGFFRADDLH